MPKHVALVALVIWALLLNTFAQVQPIAQQAQPAVASVPSTSSAPALEDGTPVKLRIARTVSSADSRVGETVDFEVLEEIRVDNMLVVPKGGLALATITEAQAKRRMGHGGKLDINIDHVRLVDGEKAALRAVKTTQGGGHVGAMTGAIVATSLVFWPAAPFFLFMHGKDITIPKGTEITAYVNGNLPLDAIKFQHSPTGAALSNAATNSTQINAVAELEISSTPDGAEISIDGNFVGNTPSTVSMPAGEHTIAVQLAGYQTWERKVRTSSGKVKISAALVTGTPADSGVRSDYPSTARQTVPASEMHGSTISTCDGRNVECGSSLGDAARAAKAKRHVQEQDQSQQDARAPQQ